MSIPEAYTVGWICAVLVEYIAAQEFFDEKHEQPTFVQPHDDNNYALGRIGQHNVVIATLPNGEYGTTSAARVAANMLGSFPNIRFGLMVGIGGGAPSEQNDIRLGDIVVSAPRDGDTGVFQYDFGKTIQDQEFQYTRTLNQPPTVLRSAVAGIRAQYKRKGHQLQPTIDAILSRNSKLRDEFKRPDQSTDRLFVATVTNDPSRAVDETCLVRRRERTKEEDNPAIHYGTIASANQLMKDATIRDKLAAEKNVLCFDMEAAGLMNHFPCLVIRGICDYSDSHKTKEWQGYAAMAAAAYAKDLLRTIPPSTVEAQQTIRNILETSITKGFENLRTAIDTNQNEGILNWLASENHNHQQARYRDERHRDTGLWFLGSTEFQSWENGRGKTMFCPGTPGVGKTIMTSIVIDHLLSTRLDAKTGIAFFYLDYADQQEQTLTNLLAGLLRQLAYSDGTIHDSVKMLYNNRNKAPRPTLKDISDALTSVTSSFETVFFIVDALDECQSPKCRKGLMEELLRLQSQFEANIFTTSRPNPKITQMLPPSSVIIKEIVASSKDLENYVLDELLKVYPGGVNEYMDLLDEAKRDILHAGSGIFLIVRLYLNLLHDRDVSTPEELKQALQELGMNANSPSCQRTRLLEDIYAKTMKRIKLRREELTMRTLLWVTCSRRKITCRELQHALGAAEYPQRNVVPMERILSLCLGLVTIDPATNYVRFTHNTAHEYFASTRDEHFPDTDTEMTKTCLAYLLNTETNVNYSKEFERHNLSHPFYMYAASNWGHHARNTSNCLDVILKFLRDDAKVNMSGHALMSPIEDPRETVFLENFVVPAARNSQIHLRDLRVRAIHLVAFFGLEQVFHHWIDSGVSPKSWLARQEFKKQLSQEARMLQLTPLHYAIIGGHKGLVKLLLEHGAKVNKEDLNRQTPYALAASCHRWDIAELLQKHGGKSIVENTTESARKWSMLFFQYFMRISL
ncbi:hypothetical protein FQN50_002343 [Emmonsiellopsis sp. PD_5]|nr:hypothetical protein FQN50_002343 [Emmonsiellopsis sp. PD_5]